MWFSVIKLCKIMDNVVHHICMVSFRETLQMYTELTKFANNFSKKAAKTKKPEHKLGLIVTVLSI